MINIYTGTPGSGKSLHAASQIIGHLRCNRLVIVNFEIDRDKVPNSDKLIIMENDKLQTPKALMQTIKDYWQSMGTKVKEGSIILIIDEAQLLFNSRTWAKTQGSGWINFFTQHRKYGIDVTLITQFSEMLDRQIRSLVEYEFVHRKFSNAGGDNLIEQLFLFIVNILTGKRLFVAVKIWYPLRQKISSDFYVAHKGLYGIYDTFKIWE